MISRRLIKILLTLSLALLWHASSSRDCHADAFAYIPNSANNNLSIIKVVDRSDQGMIDLGADPYGVAVGEEYIYVSNSSDGTVSVISISYNKVGDTLAAGNSPRGIAATSDGLYIYVANYSDNTLSVLSDGDRTTLNVGDGPLGVALSRDEEYLYVTNNSDDSLSVISADTNELFTTLANHRYIEYLNTTDDVAFNKPYGVAVSPDGEYIFVVNNGNKTLSILSAAEIYLQGDNFDWENYDPDDDSDGPYSLYAPVAVGNDPRCVAVTPDQGYAYVTNYGDDTVSVISLADFSVSANITVGNGPYGISVTPSGAFVYVVNQLDGTVSVIDTDYDSDNYNTVIATLDVGNSPVGFGTFIGGKPPKAPSNLKATRNGTYDIDLTWEDNSDDEIGFKIIRKRYINGTYSQIAILSENTTSFSEQGLEGTSNYYYQVVAYNHAGNSEYSNEAYATTGDDSGGCFIATAVYGSPMGPHLKALRDILDRFLTH